MERFVSHVYPTAAFEAHAEELLCLDRELHRQLAQHLLAESVHDHRDRVFLGDAALAAVEELVLADLRGGRLVLDGRAGVLHLDVGEGVRAALVAEQQRIALAEVARAVRLRADAHEPAVALLAAAGARCPSR